MSFNVSAAAYDRFMGRFSEPLAEEFLDLLEVRPGHRVLDVGCGPGALTARLVERVGVTRTSAADPSEPFVAAVAARLPGLDVRRAAAEDLPYEDDSFDVVAAQLVVHFMPDPVAGLAEMSRVTRPGGIVGACVWDHAGGAGPLSLFWEAVADLDPTAPGEAELPGTREGHLAEIAVAAGLSDVRPSTLEVSTRFTSFAQWWEPFTLGVGPAGAYVAGLGDAERAALAEACRRRLPAGPSFTVGATAWAVTARA